MKTRMVLFIGIGLLLVAVGCSDDTTGANGGENGNNDEEDIETFDGSTYSDDYTSRSSWSNRSQWNLANVHDLSVVKDGEYYYMYQTNASYGNVHQGHGNYPGI